jgi:hypothetical protein
VPQLLVDAAGKGASNGDVHKIDISQDGYEVCAL